MGQIPGEKTAFKFHPDGIQLAELSVGTAKKQFAQSCAPVRLVGDGPFWLKAYQEREDKQKLAGEKIDVRGSVLVIAVSEEDMSSLNKVKNQSKA